MQRQSLIHTPLKKCQRGIPGPAFPTVLNGLGALHHQFCLAIFSAFSANWRASINSLDLSVEDIIEIIYRKPDPVIRHTALGEIIRPDLGAPVTRTHKAFAVTADLFLLFAHLFFIEFCTQHLHGFLAVAQLTALRLANGDDTGRHMGFKNTFVSTLFATFCPPGAAAPGSLHLHIALLQFKVHFFRFRHHGNGRRTGVDPPARFLVSGTRCTRWTPLSNLSVPYTSSPMTSTCTSLYPPTVPSLSLRIAVFQPLFSQYLIYIRSKSPREQAGFVPAPYPALYFQRIAFFSSCGSLPGINSCRIKDSSLSFRSSKPAVSALGKLPQLRIIPGKRLLIKIHSIQKGPYIRHTLLRSFQCYDTPCSWRWNLRLSLTTSGLLNAIPKSSNRAFIAF